VNAETSPSDIIARIKAGKECTMIPVKATERKPTENGMYCLYIRNAFNIGFFNEGRFSGIHDLTDVIWLEFL
jgi:hypothetical protein